MNHYAAALRRAGLSASEAERKGVIFGRLHRASEQLRFGALDAFYVPGRIEVLGKHTDYGGGRSLVCCVERGFCGLASARSDRRVRFADISSGSIAEFELTRESHAPPLGWAIYPATVARRVVRNFPAAETGVDFVFSSDLPPGAGISSSSALMVASFFALDAANGLSSTAEFQQSIRSPEDLASYLACVENGSTFGELAGEAGVGTFGGSEDHAAILCCEPGNISQFSFCPLRFERAITVPNELTFVIGTSGVAAEKTGTAQKQYNRLASMAASIVEIWNRAAARDDPSIGSALASAPGAADRIRELLRNLAGPSAGALLDRFEQFFAETYENVPRAADALSRGDWNGFGELVDRSQRCAEDLLQNQIPETTFLVRTARELGAIAASAFGAGFGGSVWALVPVTRSDEFLRQWSGRYRERLPHRSSATFFLSGIGPAAQTRLAIDER